MVAHDEEFKTDLTKLSDEKLWARRQKFVSGLYNGFEGSQDNVEKKALIAEVDREFDRRYRKGDNKRSNIAIVISIIALLISLGGFLIELWKKIILNQ
jgi:hypothetical protein